MADTNTKYSFLDYEGLSLFWNNVKNVIKDNELITTSALTTLNTRVDTVEDALANQIISITYTELKTLRDSGQLVPGQQYKITDYTCTTTTAGTTSAGHVFDIIVTADSESVLNEEARAIQHTGDSYFSGCDLNAWKIWYCLDNDTSRFVWADETNGKGVIYRMIDEFNNDVPYDFKNIQFYRKWDSNISNYIWSTISSDNTGVPCYTFSSEGSRSTTTFTDMSLGVSNKVYSNVINGYVKNNKQILNNNCFFGNDCYSNYLGNNCYNNSFGKNFYYNNIGNNCYSNYFGNTCFSNSFGSNCYSNYLGGGCYYNSFGTSCYSNRLDGGCQYNIFGTECANNTLKDSCSENFFGNDCLSNTLGNNCGKNSFGNYCSYNSFGYGCSYNSFGNLCPNNIFGESCSNNSFGNGCWSNHFGNWCCYNSFGNGCSYNLFMVRASTSGALKDFAYYNHFDDGCSYNVIWNSDTTSSNVLLKNINVNRGVVGTSSSYNMINIDVLNSEQEINVNKVNGSILISKSTSNIVSITYESLKTLRDSSKLIPGQQYRIIDYITTTSQENTQSVGHQFDIIVTALNESTLSEEAQAIQNNIEGYFDGSNLSAWKIWYCLDNDTSRFAWAGDVKVDEIEYKSYDSSQCTIKPELINGNAFITPFNFKSCVWVDGNNDGAAYSDDHIHHDISELIYEWGYFTDENGVKQLCIYKSDANLYAEEGHPDYGDKYLYRGVVNVDGTEYDYWQKWDEWDNGGGSIYIQGGDDYVYATTQRIVSNPEAYSVTIKTKDIYGPGKGVIYRMIDEWNNDVPYDFKNIQFNGVWGYWAYTFNWVNDNSDNTCEDLSVAQYAHTNDEGGYSHTYGNVIKPCEDASSTDYGYPLKLNACVFLNTESSEYGFFYGCYNNVLESDCCNNTFGSSCYNNAFGRHCSDNSFGSNCSNNSFGSNYYNNTFGDGCSSNTFGNSCDNNNFGDECQFNTFGNDCNGNTFGESCRNNVFRDECWYNNFESNCGHNFFRNLCRSNSFRSYCICNAFGNSCANNSFGNYCSDNSFGNECKYNSFRVSADKSSTSKDYVQYNHFDDGCSYNVIWNNDTTSSSVLLKNINVNRGIRGTGSSYNMININTLNQDYEIQVAKNSKGEIKIYCEADLIA